MNNNFTINGEKVTYAAKSAITGREFYYVTSSDKTYEYKNGKYVEVMFGTMFTIINTEGRA